MRLAECEPRPKVTLRYAEAMGIPVFLSHPRPHSEQQEELVTSVREYFVQRDLDPRTLGVSDYDTEVPLASIRRLMLECNGVLVLALKRYRIEEGAAVISTRKGKKTERDISGKWLTSPWCQIEAGMGFQLGLPVLVFREDGVLADGVVEQGVMASYMLEISLKLVSRLMCENSENAKVSLSTFAPPKTIAGAAIQRPADNWRAIGGDILWAAGSPSGIPDLPI